MRVLLRMGAVLAGVLLLAAPGVAAAQGVDRLTDNDIKRLIDNVDQARDRFEDQLDGSLKRSVVRGPAGEIQVLSALEDFQRDVNNLKSRFAAVYAASAEVQAVLRRAGRLMDIMQAQPPGTKGASEWDKLAAELRGLAAAYEGTFPLGEAAAVRRINDNEAATAASMVRDQAEILKKAVNADKTLAKAEKETLKIQAEDVIKAARLLESRLMDHQPASAEMRALGDKLAPLTAEGRTLPAAALKSIGAMRAPLEKLQRAFGLAARTPTTY